MLGVVVECPGGFLHLIARRGNDGDAAIAQVPEKWMPVSEKDMRQGKNLERKKLGAETAMNTIIWANVALCILLSAAIVAQALPRPAVLKRQTARSIRRGE